MQNIKHFPRRAFAATGLATALALGFGSVHAQQPATPHGQMQQDMRRDNTPAQGQAPAMGQGGSGMGQPGARSKLGRGERLQPMPTLTIRDVYDHVQAAGYRELREIELEKGRWEVKALDAEGNPVKLYVNGSSGEIEHVKHKASGSRTDGRNAQSNADFRNRAGREYGAWHPARVDYDHAMRPVMNRALPGTSAWGWRYFSDPAAHRAVIISPAGDYYLSEGDGPRWIFAAQSQSGQLNEALLPQIRSS